MPLEGKPEADSWATIITVGTAVIGIGTAVIAIGSAIVAVGRGVGVRPVIAIRPIAVSIAIGRPPAPHPPPPIADVLNRTGVTLAILRWCNCGCGSWMCRAKREDNRAS